MKTPKPWPAGGRLWPALLLALFMAGCAQRTEPPALPSLPKETASQDESCPTPTDADSQTIDEKERVYLWDLEHHGNLLNKFGFKPLAEALVRADRKALLALLAPDFQGQTLSQPREIRMTAEFGEAVRREDSGKPPLDITAAAFADQLLELRQPFGKPPKAQLSLMTLSPVQRYNLESAWQGTAMLRMWGESSPGKPREVTAFLKYGMDKPVPANLKAGGWLRSCSITQTLVSHASHYLLRDATAECGIDTKKFHDNWNVPPEKISSSTGSVGLCDFNRDGILDLYIADLTGFYLYQGLPDGTFKEVTREVGLRVNSQETMSRGPVAIFVDLDGDGWEDLILAGHFYRNEEGKRFVMMPTNLRLPEDTGDVAVADFDCDGKVDLYLVRVSRPNSGSWLSGKAGIPQDNRLWRNLGNWQFEDVTERSGNVGGGGRSTFSALWFDANNDGWPDLYVLNEFGNGVLYVNQGNGTFKEQQLVDHPCDFGTMGAICGDIDNDGNIDLYCCNMYSKAGSRVIGNLLPDAYPKEVMEKMRRFVAGSQLHHNLGGLKFEQLGAKYQVAAVGWAYGAALVDLDNDGFLDLYATCGYSSRSRSEPDG
jgi:hypothetical protein